MHLYLAEFPAADHHPRPIYFVILSARLCAISGVDSTIQGTQLRWFQLATGWRVWKGRLDDNGTAEWRLEPCSRLDVSRNLFELMPPRLETGDRPCSCNNYSQ
jgi:hypothetical protein